jgi:quinol-cytochrome oxidoreductase complex cytochrome b subunit
MPFFPHFLLRDLFAWTVALALLAGLSAFYPWELGAKANPFAPAPAGIRPEWYFLWMFELLKLAPSTVAGVSGELIVIAGLGCLGVALFCLPVLTGRRERVRHWVSWIVIAVAVLIVAMTILALRAGAGGTQ